MTAATRVAERGTSSFVKTLDLFGAIAGIASLAYLAVRHPDPFAMELADGQLSQDALYGVLALLILGLLLLAQRARRGGMVPRTFAYGVLTLLFIGTGARLLERHDYSNFPPNPANSMSGRFGELKPDVRARWGAIVAAHRIATTLPIDAELKMRGDTAALRQLTIPATWVFPPDVEIATTRDAGDTLWIWARTSDGVLDCASLPTRETKPLCDTDRAKTPTLAWAHPARVQELTPADPRDSVGLPWTQYRGDAAKHAAVAESDSADPGYAWRWRSGSQFRSSASAVGNMVLIGAHANGDIAALDLSTGRPIWRSRTANWIHQDIVSDGRIAVVGFGDNFPSTWGRAPSGVAAYSLKTGRFLWSQFDEASVMTSPLIYGDEIVYATNAGVVRKRSLATGDLIATTRFPWGGATMAPPSMIGDTAVFTVDLSWTCALQMRTLATLWCTHLRGIQLAGHSAAAIGGGLVIGSNPVAIHSGTIADLFRLPPKLVLRALWSELVPPGTITGQQMVAMDLHTGAVRWKSRIFGYRREVVGHTSGTPTLADTVGVIVMPYADSLVSFRVADGAIRWTAGAHQARGPATIIGTSVVLSGRDGVIEVRNLHTGALTCSATRTVGYDRAGPAVVGKTLIFADLNGDVEAIPVGALLGCDAARLKETGAPKDAPAVGAHAEH